MLPENRNLYNTAKRKFFLHAKSFVLLLALLTTVSNIAFFFIQYNNYIPKPLEVLFGSTFEDQTIEPGIQNKILSIIILSSKDQVQVNLSGGFVVYQDLDPTHGRGIHMVALNPTSGQKTFAAIYDTYSDQKEINRLVDDYNELQQNRIVIFAAKDEITYNLKDEGRAALKKLGSSVFQSISWRDNWIMVVKKGGVRYAEDLRHSPSTKDWAQPLVLTVDIKKEAETSPVSCFSDFGSSLRRRRHFCQKYDGYKSVCNCQKRISIDATAEPIPSKRIAKVPVLVMAGNRPRYLFRNLQTLLMTPGAIRSMITVYIDGYHEEVVDVCRLLQVNYIEHPSLCSKNCRISQHYRRSLESAFNNNKDAKNVIILEEDLEVSPDIFEYFAATMPLLDLDLSIYCISAWNDQGYLHTCNDPVKLYRIETMPGLGWVLSRHLWEELRPQWPDESKFWDWDMWMRSPHIRKGRECIIPDISRTFHFGVSGLNVHPYFFEHYFAKHALNQVRGNRFDVSKVLKDSYEQEIERIIQSASLVDHGQTPCSNEDFVPRNMSGQTYVAYIRMQHSTDFETWLGIAKCYKIWDLDVRGFHRSMFRLSPYKNHLVIIGYPASAYSPLKPDHVVPIFIPKKQENE